MSELLPTAMQSSNSLAAAEPQAVSVASRYRMAKGSLGSVIPYMSYGAQRIGAAGIIGLSLCVFSLFTFISGNAPLHESISEQSSRLEAARTEAEPDSSGYRTATPGQKAATFVKELPVVDDIPALMGGIVAIASKSGIELERGTYEYIAADSNSIARYEMSLPVVGTYPEVRQFIENVLAATPSIALEKMRIERGKVTDQRITADLQFAILLGVTQ